MDVRRLGLYEQSMSRIRASWRLAITLALLLAAAVVGFGVSLPSAGEHPNQVRPYDPMPRW